MDSSSLSSLSSLNVVGQPNVGTTVRIVRTIKRRLSAKDLLIGPNMEVKRRKLRRGSCFVGSDGIMEVIHSHHHQQMMVANPMLMRQMNDTTVSVKGAHMQQPTTLVNVNVPPPPPDVFRPAATYGIGGRRLRQRSDTNYAESGRRSGGGTGAIAAAAAAAAEAEANGCGGSRSNSTCSNGSTNSTLSAGSAFGLLASGRMGADENGLAAKASASTQTVEALGCQASMGGKRFAIRGKRIGLDGHVQYLIDWD